jgi:mannose-6-phosphate isomerase-like protein (cupin superfamily)
MMIRRLVTGHRAAKAIVFSNEQVPRSHDFQHIPGMATALVWSTPPLPTVPHSGADPISPQSTFIPPPGETRLMVMSFPPFSVAAKAFGTPAAVQESLQHMTDLAAKMERDNPGMHVTDTVDYAIVLEGEVWLELDDDEQVQLRPHDIVIQNGTRHGWRNKSDKPVTIAFVLIGAQRKAATH